MFTVEKIVIDLNKALKIVRKHYEEKGIKVKEVALTWETTGQVRNMAVEVIMKQLINQTLKTVGRCKNVIIENDGVECTNCGMEISDEEQFEFKDHTYCCDCIVGALVNEGYIKQIK